MRWIKTVGDVTVVCKKVLNAVYPKESSVFFVGLFGSGKLIPLRAASSLNYSAMKAEQLLFIAIGWQTSRFRMVSLK